MRTALACSVCLVVTAGCFNPDDIFPVTGTLQSVGPVEGQVVQLLRQVDTSNFGTGCSGADARAFKEATADAAGTFGFEVFRAQSQNLTSLGTYCFRVDTTFSSGATASSQVYGIFGTTKLGTLRDWRSGLEQDAGVLVFTPPIPVPPETAAQAMIDPAIPQLDHRVEVLTAAGDVVWQADDHLVSLDGGLNHREPLVMDDARLEDFEGTLALHARVVESEAAQTALNQGFDVYSTELRAAELRPVVGHAPATSRGARCTEISGVCPFTDGDLTPVDVGSLPVVTLELDTPQDLAWLVLRGVETPVPFVVVVVTDQSGIAVQTFRVELPVSAWSLAAPRPPRRRRDGAVGTGPMIPTTPVYAVIPLPAAAGIRSVSLRFPGGLQRAAELSLVSP